MSLTSEQLEERLNYICGSDAAVICGVSPWGNIVQLWQEKTRQIHRKDISDNPYIKAGNFLEPAVKAWFEHETGLKVTIDNNLIVHPEIPYLAGNIDGRVGDDAIFEAKTASHDEGWGQTNHNQIPDHYLLQISHYMLVANVQKAHVAVLIRGNDFRYYTIERNPKLEEMMLRKYREFWKCVTKNIAPTPSNGAEVLSLYGYRSIEDQVTADNDIEENLEKLNHVRESIKKASELKDKLEDKIKIYMGQKDTLLTTSGKIAATWKEAAESRRFDMQAFKEENEELHNKYVKTGAASRRFIFKQQQEGQEVT
jgi:putative phage-type endonuclease